MESIYSTNTVQNALLLVVLYPIAFIIIISKTYKTSALLGKPVYIEHYKRLFKTLMKVVCNEVNTIWLLSNKGMNG